MKLTLIATAFAALLSTGYATETNDRNLDAVLPTAGVASPAIDEGKRTLVAEKDAAAAKAPKMTNEEKQSGWQEAWFGKQGGLLRPVLQPLL